MGHQIMRDGMYDVTGMREALTRHGTSLNHEEVKLLERLAQIETERGHLEHAWDGLRKLEDHDVAAMAPTEDHYNYIDFLQWVASNVIDFDVAAEQPGVKAWQVSKGGA